MASSEKPITICVFCGAREGNNPAYMAAARSLAEAMHGVGAHLVYGGGTVGLMGEVARRLVALSGPEAVHGIIPAALIKYEQGGGGGSGSGGAGGPPPAEAVYGRTTVVRDMHTRKAAMAKEVLAGAPGSGFVALPGGYGTLEELMEITTWNQLGIHKSPVAVFNVAGYYDGLISWVRRAVDDAFIAESNAAIITEAADAAAVLAALRDYKPAEGRFNLDWDSTSPVEEKTSFT